MFKGGGSKGLPLFLCLPGAWKKLVETIKKSDII
jgi:hypothetical protein